MPPGSRGCSYGATARQKSSSSARSGPTRANGVPVSKIEHLVADVENDAAGAGALHDVDRTFQRHGPADEVEYHDEVVVLVQREAGPVFTSLERCTKWPMSLIGSPSCSNQTRPRTTKKSTKSSLKVHAGLKVEQSIVSDFDEIELVALRGGACRRGGSNSERQSNDGETDQGALHVVSVRERGRQNLPPRYPPVTVRLLPREDKQLHVGGASAEAPEWSHRERPSTRLGRSGSGGMTELTKSRPTVHRLPVHAEIELMRGGIQGLDGSPTAGFPADQVVVGAVAEADVDSPPIHTPE